MINNINNKPAFGAYIPRKVMKQLIQMDKTGTRWSDGLGINYLCPKVFRSGNLHVSAGDFGKNGFKVRILDPINKVLMHITAQKGKLSGMLQIKKAELFSIKLGEIDLIGLGKLKDKEAIQRLEQTMLRVEPKPFK